MKYKVFMTRATCAAILLIAGGWFVGVTGQDPVKIGIAGLSHSHVLLLLRDLQRENIRIVGIAEKDTVLANNYIKQFSLDKDIVFESLEEMLDMTEPEGVVVFTSIYDHLKVVRECARRGIHVMVEKPLAINLSHARRMAGVTGKFGTLLLTNYETTWYPSYHKAFSMWLQGSVGSLRKVIVYDGHMGPKEIKVNDEFLCWLTDPELNGGGAVTDFGCYGADVMTWLANGRKPQRVSAVLKTYKPEVYPRVDDDATIIMTYPEMECIINASWNWPFNRKDIHFYGTDGYILCDDAYNIRYRTSGMREERHLILSSEEIRFTDPFAFFSAAIRDEVEISDTDLSSLPVNMTVVSILDAAKRSNRKGKHVRVK